MERAEADMAMCHLPEPLAVPDPFAAPAADVAARLDVCLDAAMERPVGITWDGEPRVVMLSIEDDARLMRRDRQAVRVEDMGDDMLGAILNAEPGKRSEDAGRRLDDPATG